MGDAVKATRVEFKDIVKDDYYKLLCDCGRYRMIIGHEIKNSPVKMFKDKKHKSHELTLYTLRERT